MVWYEMESDFVWNNIGMFGPFRIFHLRHKAFSTNVAKWRAKNVH